MLSILFCVASACTRADEVVTTKSPIDGVFFTAETWYGLGPIVNDHNEVYAHLERGSRSDKRLVLEGNNMAITKIVWDSGGHDVRVCIGGGLVKSFRDEVTLKAGDASITLHNQLREDC